MGQSLLLHDLLGEKDDLPIQEEEPRQPVSADQMELFIQTGLHLQRHGPIAAQHRLGADASEIAARRCNRYGTAGSGRVYPSPVARSN